MNLQDSTLNINDTKYCACKQKYTWDKNMPVSFRRPSSSHSPWWWPVIQNKNKRTSMKGAVVIIQGCDLHQVWQIFLNRALCLVWFKHSTGVNSKWGFSMVHGISTPINLHGRDIKFSWNNCNICVPNTSIDVSKLFQPIKCFQYHLP